MIIFHNPGVIDLDAVRLMGVSVKEPGAFGRFGTGLKYAIATILRNGGQVSLARQREDGRVSVGSFTTDEVEVRGRTFHEVSFTEDSCGMDMNITTELGKDWEPWMVVRELGCNARDEGGGITHWTAEPLLKTRELCPPNSGHDQPTERLLKAFEEPSVETALLVDWPELEEKWPEVFAQTFAPEGEVLLEEAGVRVLPGPSEYLYHRGVRVWKLPRPSVFTYDVVKAVDLTEDRTVKYSFCVVADVRNMILATADRSIIAAAVSASKDTWEGAFDWTGQQWCPTSPGHDWLEEVATLREAKAGVTKSAADVFLAHSALKTATVYVGGSYDSPTGTFGEAAEELSELGIDVAKVNTFVVDELPGEARTTIRGGSVYATLALIEEGSRLDIAREMLTRYLELKSGGDHDTLLRLVVPLLLDQSFDLKRERKVEEARAEGLRPTMVESFLGLHPVLDPVGDGPKLASGDDVPF